MMINAMGSIWKVTNGWDPQLACRTFSVKKYQPRMIRNALNLRFGAGDLFLCLYV